MSSFTQERFSASWLTAHLSAEVWQRDSVVDVRVERIGADFGFSGEIYRLTCTTSSNESATLVAKVEPIEKIERAISFRNRNETAYADYLARSYGSHLDRDLGVGILLLEDISPARQGDDLRGCSKIEALRMTGAVVRLHSLAWSGGPTDRPTGIERWVPPLWDGSRWTDRLSRVARRYPQAYTDDVMQRLASLNDEANSAASELAGGPSCWIHRDPHLDNVMWRPDGRLVLLDWSGAVVGPPGIDVAVLLTSLALRDGGTLLPDRLLVAYRSGLQRHGVNVAMEQVGRQAMLGLVLLIRGLVGWAGLPDEIGTRRRQSLIRDDSVNRVLHALDWLESVAFFR